MCSSELKQMFSTLPVWSYELILLSDHGYIIGQSRVWAHDLLLSGLVNSTYLFVSWICRRNYCVLREKSCFNTMYAFLFQAVFNFAVCRLKLKLNFKVNECIMHCCQFLFDYLHCFFFFFLFCLEEANGICRSPYDGVESRLTGSSGTFFSPNYPTPYPTKATCIWQITVPEGKVVKLTFKNFDYVKMHLSACLEIRDSLISTGKEIGSHNCRSDELNLTKSVYSSGRYMFVKFQSHSYVGWIEEGFKASFEAVGAGQPTSTCEYSFCYYLGLLKDPRALSCLVWPLFLSLRPPLPSYPPSSSPSLFYDTKWTTVKCTWEVQGYALPPVEI